MLRHAPARVAAAVLAVVVSAAAVAAQTVDIRLGVIAGMTGLGASYGIGIRQGAEMAAREINDAGGIAGRRLALVFADDASEPARSVIAMQRLTNAGVDAIVGGWGSSQVLANLEVAERAGIPYVVVGATSPAITRPANRWTFRVIQNDSGMAQHIADVAVRRLSLRRIAVINDSNDYGAGNRDVFIAGLRQAGVEPVLVQSYQSADRDFAPQLARLRSAAPDGIAVFGTVPAAPAIMNQARAAGIGARFLGTGGLANETLILLAPKSSEGTVLTTYFHEDVDDESRAWAARLMRDFAGAAAPPRPILSAWTYRAVSLIVAPCLRQAGDDRAAVRDCIAAWRGRLFGVQGEAYFDRAGQLVQAPLFVTVRGGAFTLFKAGD